jgi:site-specific DNA-methyltransferase (adenine-specific)
MTVPAPYYVDEHVALYCGDFRDLLPDVLAEHGAPDLVLTDPPYGETSLEWDRWPDGWPALMPGRSMWCFGSMRMYLDHGHEFSGWRLSHDVVWQKTRPSTVTTDRFARIHEHSLHWYRGPWGEVYHQTPKVPHHGRKVATARRSAVAPNIRGAIGSSVWEDDGTRWHPSIIRARNMHRSAAINATEKPIGLVETLLGYGCPPGGFVLDVFAGSCSTLVAARNTGRRAVGIELREEQCAKAVEWRLSQAVLPFGDAS